MAQRLSKHTPGFSFTDLVCVYIASHSFSAVYQNSKQTNTQTGPRAGIVSVTGISNYRTEELKTKVAFD
jgi:hypothetical protein